MITLYRKHSKSSLCLLLLFLSLSAGCQAIKSEVKKNVAISVPIVLFAVAVGVICTIYWACYCNAWRRHKPTLSAEIRQTYYQTSIDEQSVSVPAYIPALPSVITVPDESESCPQNDELPEAELHQGDAPPAYADAVNMTTVIV